MRKKSPAQGGFNNNQNRKPRFSGGGNPNNNGGGGNNSPRKNYSAMREKYLQQARDALAAGDRVLAENYFQHADHCFRMIAEENANRPQPRHNSEQQSANNAGENAGEQSAEQSNE